MADSGQDGMLRELLLFAGAVVTALLGKGVWDFVSGKTKAEKEHITASSDVSLVLTANAATKDVYELFRQVTAELRESGVELKHLKQRHNKTVALVWKLLDVMKQRNYEGIAELEREANEILEV